MKPAITHQLSEGVKILQVIQRVCSEVTGIEASEIKPSWSFFEDLGVGMDELAEIFSRVSLQFNVKIGKEQVPDLVTVGNLLEFIEEQL